MDQHAVRPEDAPGAHTVQEMYGEADGSAEPVEDILGRSLSPRGPEMLFDLAERLGVGPASRVLDIGSRDGRHLFELARRFGCDAVGIEPVPANLHRGRCAWEKVRDAEPDVAARVR